MRWTVLIPAKSLPEAKSRLSGSTQDARAHERLVLAMRADTMSAARQPPNVARIVVIADRPSPDAPGADLTLVQTEPGLNPALREAANYCAHRWPQDGIAALVGDLPALAPEELGDALNRAALSPRAFAADSQLTGTTLLTAMPGYPLEPAFGEGSAARHAESATALLAGAGLRQDVDTQHDLLRALELGVGPQTLACTAAETLIMEID